MKLTDEKLYELCKKYGAATRFWRQRFIGLLPEVNRRRLYEKKGFSSVFEFAFKLCGLSAQQVRLALNLSKRFEDKPNLKKMLESGEASINKLTRIVSIATPENEKELAERIRVLPTMALNTLVRDEKYLQEKTNFKNGNGLNKLLFEDKDLYVQTLDFELAHDIKEQLNELHSKGLDVNELLREMLQRRREEIAKAKYDISESIEPTQSRYIPAKIKQILKEEYGQKCSIATCQKSAETIHHTQRFSLSRNHDPRFLAPLCRDHHIIAHSIDADYHRIRKLAAKIT
ncbi:hypothetical protein HYW83_01710 [Candidatus Peregrinibacteria bacterium]|nr:hypothetical protein [Candidatus Peregrinibacteria bacterium]